jgi:uncharacterized protein YndB with AHSA1/START domain
MKRRIDRTVHYPHPPDRVWQSLATTEALAAWLMPNDFQPKLGHRFTFRTKPRPGFDGIVRCEVLEIDPPRTMVWSWEGGGMKTVVTFRLSPTADGTRVHLRHEGFEGLRPVLVSYMLGRGWAKMLARRVPAVLADLARGELPKREAC